VAVDARLPYGRWGGVQEVVCGLASGLGSLDGEDRFVFVLQDGSQSWLEPHLRGPASAITVGRRSGRTLSRHWFDRISTSLPFLESTADTLAAALPERLAKIPNSDGTGKRLGVDLIHFAMPQAYRTTLPSIYQPHDLLHVHYPQLLGRARSRYRARAYSAFAHRAAFVVAMTEWGRRDLLTHIGVAPERVAVIPWAPAIQLSVASAVPGLAAEGSVPASPFLLYPAQAWPHKNHARLLEAVALLRARGIHVVVVCTGRLNEHSKRVREHAARLGVSDLVQFPGYVSAPHLRALYDAATALIFPSRFEGWGLPVVEAFALGLPVACSNVTALPEVAGEAALLFDPDDVVGMAEAMQRLLEDEALRADLRHRGHRRASGLSWNHTARTFRALYRLATDQDPSTEDQALVAPPTLVA
jgi:glycosyltransferase involved in cell wall biosynthesis